MFVEILFLHSILSFRYFVDYGYVRHSFVFYVQRLFVFCVFSRFEVGDVVCLFGPNGFAFFDGLELRHQIFDQFLEGLVLLGIAVWVDVWATLIKVLYSAHVDIIRVIFANIGH